MIHVYGEILTVTGYVADSLIVAGIIYLASTGRSDQR